MAESVVFNLASKILSTIASPVFEKAYEKGLLIWEARDELVKLQVTIETIQAVLLDAEKKQQGSAAVKNWIKRLKGVLYDADDLFDEVTTDDMIKQQIMKENANLFSKKGKRSVWLKLPIEYANLVDAAVKEGFYDHHAEPNYLMLARWLPETENILHANASHGVGVGAFVVNEKKEFMQIDTKFLEVLTFRQSHNAFFQKSDLYFVCFLEPSSFDIQIQESEILAAKWMSFEEYAAQPFVQKHDRASEIRHQDLLGENGRQVQRLFWGGDKGEFQASK